MNTGSRLGPFLLLALLAACDAAGPESPYTVLGNRLDTLRAAFNADAGHVRVLMLASPT